MAVDAFERLRQAEQLLRQGKAGVAIDGLRELSQRLPEDLPTLNRIGDLLARFNHAAEAAVHYRKIAAQYTKQGHLAKASAIYKKLLRLDSDPTESLLELGRLQLRQKLPGEAAGYLQKAATALVERRDHVGAARAYELLIEADPRGADHRGALGEALAAAGDPAAAAAQFLALGETQTASAPDKALAAYRRALDLRPESPEATLGLARCLSACGRAAEGIQVLERAAAAEAPSPALLGALLLAYETEGRGADSLRLAARPEARAIADASWESVFRTHLGRGTVQEAWERFGALFQRWTEQGMRERVGTLLERLGQLEPQGHLPALTRLLEQLNQAGDRAGAAAVLQRLARVYEERGMTDEREAALARLNALGARSAEPPAEERDPADPGAGPAAPPAGNADAPAVPLNRSEREFVTGRLTQAEILEKYGLVEQALDQVREVVGKFPGHVEAHQRLAQMLRATGGQRELVRVLASLAVAARASGEHAAAREAVAEAVAAGKLPAEDERRLKQLGLMAEERRAPAPAPAAAPSDDDVVIEFDLDEGDFAITAPEAAVPPTEPTEIAVATPVAPPLPEPEPEPELKPVERAVAPAVAAAAMDPEPVAAVAPRGVPPDAERRRGERRAGASFATPTAASELRAIAAALDEELGPIERAAPAPGVESVEEVVAAFRKQVDGVVARDDHRTHYDLGVGYKEMGLVDEAIAEFTLSAAAPQLARESHVMLGLCFRERGDLDRAVDSFREALDAPCPDESAALALRYDFGELLTQWGDPAGALEMFRAVADADPSYRDAAQRVSLLAAQP